MSYNSTVDLRSSIAPVPTEMNFNLYFKGEEGANFHLRHISTELGKLDITSGRSLFSFLLFLYTLA